MSFLDLVVEDDELDRENDNHIDYDKESQFSN